MSSLRIVLVATNIALGQRGKSGQFFGYLTVRFGLSPQDIVFLYSKYQLQHLPLNFLLPTLELWHPVGAKREVCPSLISCVNRQVVAQNWAITTQTLRNRVKYTTQVLVITLNEISWQSRFEFPFPLWGPLSGVTTAVDVTVCPIHGFEYVPQEDAKDMGSEYRRFYSFKHNLHCWKFTGYSTVSN
jgi:hypothetical protein